MQVLQVENATSQIDNADSTEVARGGEGRDESLENRSDRADDRDDDSFRQERLNDELDNSEMRQENREDRDPNFQPERN